MSASISTLALKRNLRPFVLPVALILLWLLVGVTHAIDPQKLPPLPTVLQTAQAQLAQGKVLWALVASLERGAIGFTIALVGGLAIGALLGLSGWANRLGGPTFNAFRQVAPFAWIPLLGAVFGVGEPPKIAFIAVAAFPPIVLNTINGVRAIAREHLELARVLGIDRLHFLTHILAPSAAPQVLTGIHLGLTTAWLAVIGAEYFLEAAPGLGAILLEGRASTRMDLVLIGLALTGAVGLSLNVIVLAIERSVLRWRPSPATH